MGSAIFPGDLVQVHNLSERPFTLTWDGRSVHVGPGQAKTATFEQVVNHLGHPGAGEAVQKMTDPIGNFHMVPSREDEVKRISIKGGWDLGSPHTGGLQTLVAPPDIQVYDLDGERIWTCLDDPTGEHVMVSANTAPNQADQIAHLQRQLDMLLKSQGLEANAASLNIPGVGAGPGQSVGELPDLEGTSVPIDD